MKFLPLFFCFVSIALQQKSYANETVSNTEIQEVCESWTSDEIISEWVYERNQNNADKNSLKQAFKKNIKPNQADSIFMKGVEESLFNTLDKIYADKKIQMDNENYIAYIENLEQSALSDCVKKLKAINQNYNQSNRSTGSVFVNANCAYGCFIKKFNLRKYQAPTQVIIDNNRRTTSHIVNHINHNVAGRYEYELYLENKSTPCVGTIEVRDSDKNIDLYFNNSCNLNNTTRRP